MYARSHGSYQNKTKQKKKKKKKHEEQKFYSSYYLLKSPHRHLYHYCPHPPTLSPLPKHTGFDILRSIGIGYTSIFFRHVFKRGDNCRDVLFTYLGEQVFLKRGLLLKKRICSRGSKFFSLRVDP